MKLTNPWKTPEEFKRDLDHDQKSVRRAAWIMALWVALTTWNFRSLVQSLADNEPFSYWVIFILALTVNVAMIFLTRWQLNLRMQVARSWHRMEGIQELSDAAAKYQDAQQFDPDDFWGIDNDKKDTQ